MKYVALLFCCLMSFDCAHVVDVRYTDINPNKMLEKIRPLTWELIVDYGNGLVGECLGTPLRLKKGVMILTAQHCIAEPGKRIFVKPISASPKSYQLATVYKSIEVFDLALLEPIIPIPEGYYTVLASTGPRRLDPYYQVRYHTNKKESLLFYRGHVVRIERDVLPLGSAMLSGYVIKGTSGGPVFNMRGHLICVQTYTTHCTSSVEVFRWLKSIGE